MFLLTLPVVPQHVGNYIVYLSHVVDFKVDRTLAPLVWDFNRYDKIRDEVK